MRSKGRNLVGLLANAAVLALLTGLASGCSDRSSGPHASRPNVILVSIDTLRPDHLGCYGYSRETSPAIDAFCQDAVVFAQAIAQAPSTLASHASMLTSLLPHHHQASWGSGTRLPESALTLSEVLKSVGYETAAIVGGGQTHVIFGLDQGFDLYRRFGRQDFRGTVKVAIEWLEGAHETPFFLFLHTYHVHQPYRPSQEHLRLFEEDYRGSLPDHIDLELLNRINSGELEIDSEDLQHIVNTYDAEIRAMDEGFGELVQYLKSSGLYGGSLIILTSDHGEEFGEHDSVGRHSHTLYDELLRVPLVIRFPEGRFVGANVERQVRSIDIPPTVVAEVGADQPDSFAGVALQKVLENPSLEPLIAIGRLDHSREISAVRTKELKYYRDLLFDLKRDPGEKWDASANHPGAIPELRAELSKAIRARQRLKKVRVAPENATLQELKALGYLQ